MKRLSVPLVFFALFGAATAQAGSPPVSRYMDCARAIGVAINDQLAVIPGQRSGDKGLFVYTERSAFFLPLGAPYVDDGEANEFFLRTSISAVGDIFLIFRDRTPGSTSNVQSAIGLHTTVPVNGALDSYRFTPANDSLGEQAIDAIRGKLKEKISTVKAFLNEKHRFSTPAEAKAAFQADLLVYRSRLERCRVDGDHDLNLVVDGEMKKLESGFSGVTIWEKQVGGRSPADPPR
ncbi:MAG: hypothetical protein EXR31_11050 [Betaproteobacteria bacterium]|nr:hypothetical protein [Betaproteobacteria bacterium]